MRQPTDWRQADDWSCAAVAAVAALECVGHNPSRATKLVADRLPVTPLDGCDPRTLEAFFWSVGYAVQAGMMDVGDLAHHVRRGRPIITSVQLDGSGHWVTVYAVSRNCVFYHCPTLGPVCTSRVKFTRLWWDTGRAGEAYTRFGIAVLG